jgi:hypothetical protein
MLGKVRVKKLEGVRGAAAVIVRSITLLEVCLSQKHNVAYQSTHMYIALIRTHHITSRKKVAALKAAAKQLECFALLRSGGCPGIMFVQGNNATSVQSWVGTVRNLRYKDYQLVSPVAGSSVGFEKAKYGVLREVETVRAMADEMQGNGLLEWWRRGMGFSSD